MNQKSSLSPALARNDVSRRPAFAATSLLLLALALLLSLDQSAHATSFYVHPTLGKDDNSGTSEQSAWQTLERASAAPLRAGDRLLLAAGQKFAGRLKYDGLKGEAAAPIIIATYGTEGEHSNARPVIDARGFPSGVNLRNSSHVQLRDVSITANGGGHAGQPKQSANWMRCGVLVEADRAGVYAGLVISNVVIRDVFFEEPGFVRSPEEVRTANGTQHYGWGIRFMANSSQAKMSDIRVTDCQVENVSHTGLKFTGPSNSLQNVRVERLRVRHTGGPGVQMSGLKAGYFGELDVSHTGSTNDTRNWGRGSGLWTWGSSDILVERSRFQNANGPGDSAGVHIDFNCRNVIVQHNLSANNAGGFCEILGNNYNCAYRYNISINDGHRIKGRNGAFQEGKTFWLSGYTGDRSPRHGPFNSYFYNNTIYVSQAITAKVAVTATARGVLVANNIFYFKGPSAVVVGDQNQPDEGHAATIQDVLFENNLFLREDNWPDKAPIQDRSPLIGDPQFRRPGGFDLTDYIPQNIAVIKDKGIPINRLPHDDIGLVPGLAVERDILGNEIQGRPDIGAIELPVSRPTSLGVR